MGGKIDRRAGKSRGREKHGRDRLYDRNVYFSKIKNSKENNPSTKKPTDTMQSPFKFQHNSSRSYKQILKFNVFFKLQYC